MEGNRGKKKSLAINSSHPQYKDSQMRETKVTKKIFLLKLKKGFCRENDGYNLCTSFSVHVCIQKKSTSQDACVQVYSPSSSPGFSILIFPLF